VSGWVVGGLFASREQAEQAINELVHTGLPRDHISVVARDEIYEEAIRGGIGPHGETMPANEAASVAGLDRASEPGMGSLLAAGPLGAQMEKLEGSASEHPLVEALRQRGMPATDAARCADQVRRGAVLVVAEAGPTHAEGTRHLLRQAGASAVLDGALST
jgi:hypothetical protein